jgi:hypothetical protein
MIKSELQKSIKNIDDINTQLDTILNASKEIISFPKTGDLKVFAAQSEKAKEFAKKVQDIINNIKKSL